MSFIIEGCVMNPAAMALLEKRQASFDQFYDELIATLVEFVERLGIKPPHEVLKHAVEYAPFVGHALRDVPIAGEEERVRLLARVAYFIGEYFAQKYGGCWYVNDVQGSTYFGHYVVGRFSRLSDAFLMVAPFEAAQIFVDTQPPRQLEKLLLEVNVALLAGRRAT